MDGKGWVLKLITPVVTLDGRASQLAVGVIDTKPGGAQLVLQVGDADPVIFPGLQSAAEHAANVRAAGAEKYRLDREAGR